MYNFMIKKIKNLVKFLNSQYNKYDIFNKLGSVGTGCDIKGKIFISDKSKLFLGKNVHIGDNAYFKTEGEIHIGDNCHISRNATIYSVNHNYEGSALPYDNTTIQKKVVIEKNVWIGINVNIVPGVKLGEGSIIGMGSTVTKDVLPLGIAGGNPAKIIKYRNRDHYMNLEKQGLYGGANGRPLY